MSEFNEGDLVEAVKGDESHKGRVVRRNNEPLLFDLGIGGSLYIDYLAEIGFTLTTIEKASPPLPTTPGSYLGNDDRPWRLGADGYWHRLDGVRYLPDSAERYAPFIPLEPVAETAEKVLNEVRFRLSMPSDGRRPNGELMIRTETLDYIAAEFGVAK